MPTPRKPYEVMFDRSGASYVDRDALLALPEVRAQIEAGRRIVEAYRAEKSARAQRPDSPSDAP